MTDNGDLISREALKEKLKERYYNDGLDIVTVIELIDNAPTVKFSLMPADETKEDAYKRGYKKGKIAEILKANTRPQGEWIYGEDDCGQDGWFCSECGFFVPWYYQYYEKDIDFIRDYKACPHCLAEMVTYTGKDRDMRGKEE